MSPVGRCLWPAVLATLLLVHAGSALKCFVCSSDTDSRCKDHFDKTHHTIEECKQNSYSLLNLVPYCKKEVHSADQSRQQKDTIRSCAWASVDDPGSICRDSTPHYSEQLHCSICDRDACNGAPGAAQPPAAAGVLLLAAAAAIFFRAA